MSLLVFALALPCIFPMFESTGTEGMSLVNRDSQTQEYAITLTGSEGGDASTARVTLSAGAQRAFMLREIMPVRPPASGWLRVDSAATGCFSALTVGNESALVATEAAGTTGTSLIASHVEVNTGFTELSYADTSISIVNPNSGQATVNVQIYDLSGALRGTVAVNVPAHGSRVFRVSEAFASMLPSNGLGGRTFQGYIRLESNAGIAAWLRLETPLARSVLRAKSMDDLRQTAEAVLPHFVFGGTYESTLNIINPAALPIDMELEALDDSGRRLGEVIKITLGPGEARRAPVGAFFRVPVIAIFPPPLISGYIRIHAGRNFQIAGDIEIDDLTQGVRQSSMLYPISDTPSTTWILPFAVSNAAYFTGFVVQNPNSLLTVQTDVTVEFVAPSGVVLDRTNLQLSPEWRNARLASVPNQTGYLSFTSNFPVHIVGSIGSRDHQTLDQMPAVH